MGDSESGREKKVTVGTVQIGIFRGADHWTV